MHIALLTFGSRGDVQPYVALGKGLKSAGHSVRVLTHTEFEPFIRRNGLDFYVMHGNIKAMLEGQTGQDFVNSGSNLFELLRNFSKIASEMLHGLVKDAAEGARDADLVLCTVTGYFAAIHLAEKFGTRLRAAYLQPVHPTADFPSYPFPSLPFGGWYNKATYDPVQQLGWLALLGPMNSARKDVLGLPPLPRRAPFSKMDAASYPVLYGYSDHVVPRPKEYGDWLHVTGYWFLDEDWTPPQSLLDFLNAGDKPIYIGFGSMKNRDTETTTRLVLDALKQTGQRAVISSGWDKLGASDLPPTCYRLSEAPHSWLFPRMAAVVHHCGAGTTAAGARAGVPTIPVPFFADQPFWADQIHLRGAATKPIPRKKLTSKNLAQAITQAITDNKLRDHAAQLGEKIRAEDGIGRAVELIGKML